MGTDAGQADAGVTHGAVGRAMDGEQLTALLQRSRGPWLSGCTVAGAITRTSLVASTRGEQAQSSELSSSLRAARARDTRRLTA